MEKKVVVMSGADVAAMRKAHKEAEAAYFDAKVGALEFAVEEMKSTGKEYTLHEVTAMTGLTPMEVVVRLSELVCIVRTCGLRWLSRSASLLRLCPTAPSIPKAL